MAMTTALRRIAAAAAAMSALTAGCGPARTSNEVPAAANEGGAALIRAYGCGACHVIPGVAGANGNVGPSLERLGSRVYLAGFLPNTRDNLARWIREPQRIAHATAMPDMGVTASDAQQIAAYLHRNAEAK